MKRILSTFLSVLPVCLLAAAQPSQAQFVQTNLVSDQAGVAKFTDANLINPWGLSSAVGGPWWVSDAGTGVSTLYNGAGVKTALTVTIPIPSGGTPPSSPTGQVFNSTSDFGGTRFIFVTEEGTLSAWTSGTAAVLKADNSASGAVYKGLAMANNGTVNRLYAANFNSGKIDVFSSTFASVSLGATAFTDPNLPADFAPFNVQNIGGKLYVTYAKQDAAKHDDVAGAGNGVVDVYSADGVLLQRFASGTAASGGTLSQLDSPWGLAMAPAHFGLFSNDLLVGNFGDGRINAFDAATGAFQGQLTDEGGNVISVDGLWALAPGTGGNNGSVNSLYFTAGPGNESHGLFGTFTATPEPSVWATGAIGLLSLSAFARRRRRK